MKKEIGGAKGDFVFQCHYFVYTGQACKSAV